MLDYTKPEGYKNTADAWEVLFQAKEKGRPLAARVGAIDYIENGLAWILDFGDFPGIRGLVPAEETGVEPFLQNRFVGQEIRVLIKGLDRDNNLVACSRREVVDKVAQQMKLLLHPGDIIPVVVRAVIMRENRTSLVVDVGGGVLVEIPRSKAAIRRSIPLRSQYTVGQAVNAKIMSLEPIAVSIKDAQPDPWSQVSFQRGQFLSGTVYRVAGGHVFVEPDLAPGVLGLAPLPLMGDVQRGFRVSCKVRSFFRQQKKLHLFLVNRLL